VGALALGAACYLGVGLALNRRKQPGAPLAALLPHQVRGDTGHPQQHATTGPRAVPPPPPPQGWGSG
jgi:hypothetical protein